MSKRFGAAQPQIRSYDPIWDQVRHEAEDTSANEPVLASLIYTTILSEPTLEDAFVGLIREHDAERKGAAAA